MLPDPADHAALWDMLDAARAIREFADQTPLSGELKNAGHDEGQMVFIRKTQ
jgi:hypothetical protein